MTKIHNLIVSSLSKHKKHILINTSFDKIISKHLGSHRISKNIDLFEQYDTIIIDQSSISNAPSLFEKFLSTIIVLDDISQNIDINDLEYWNNLSKIYNKYSNLYKCVFVAINEQDYVKSNHAHNFYINVYDSEGWKSII